LFWLTIGAVVLRRLLQRAAARVPAARPQLARVLIRSRASVWWVVLAAFATEWVVVALAARGPRTG
jgi:hypothetical protein